MKIYGPTKDGIWLSKIQPHCSSYKVIFSKRFSCFTYSYLKSWEYELLLPTHSLKGHYEFSPRVIRELVQNTNNTSRKQQNKGPYQFVLRHISWSRKQRVVCENKPQNPRTNVNRKFLSSNSSSSFIQLSLTSQRPIATVASSQNTKKRSSL